MAVKFEAKLPKTIPEAVNVYTLETPTVSNADLLKRSKGFGLTGKGQDFITSGDTLAYREGRYHLQVHRVSGAVHYQHVDKYGVLTDKKFDVPDKRAGTVSRKFLENVNLFPIASAQLRRVTHMRSADADPKTNKINEQIIDAGVVYGRLIDDLPVDGPGGFALVNIDPEAEVVGLRAVWRGLGKRKAKVKVKSADDVIKQFEKQASKFNGDTTVTKAGFGYFEQGPLDKQTVIEPAFWFVYVVQYGEIAHKSAYVVAAGDKTFEPLTGKRRFATPAQKQRK
jgi:hypothetical protein